MMAKPHMSKCTERFHTYWKDGTIGISGAPHRAKELASVKRWGKSMQVRAESGQIRVKEGGKE